MVYSDVQKEIRDICLRLLTRREHSQLELLDKLALRGFERAETKFVVNDLSEQNWQSQHRFAESYARHRIKKGYGPLKIAQELRQRGIKEFDLTLVVTDLVGSWDDVLEQIYEKKYTNETQLTYKERLKRNRFLQQRGFSGDMINILFKRLNIQLID